MKTLLLCTTLLTSAMWANASLAETKSDSAFKQMQSCESCITIAEHMLSLLPDETLVSITSTEGYSFRMAIASMSEIHIDVLMKHEKSEGRIFGITEAKSYLQSEAAFKEIAKLHQESKD